MSVTCPYCEHENEVCHDDWQNYEEDSLSEWECEECEKTFMISTSISYYHEWSKADCLNWWEHEWSQIHWSPKEFFVWKKRCKMCNEEKCFDIEWNKKAMKQYSEDLKK